MITTLHSVYKHVHNCIVHWCPVMTSIISVCEYQCCVLGQCSAQFINVLYWYSVQCSRISVSTQLINILYWNSFQCSGISVIAQYQHFCTGTVFSVLEYL